MKRVALVTGILLLSACSKKAEIAIINGQIWTGLSSGNPRPGMVAMAGDTIMAVGDSATVSRYLSATTKLIDAGGGLVMPGFNDSHTHFIEGGFELSQLDLRNAKTPAEFIELIASFVKTKKPGEWITGGTWDHTRWKGQPLPRHEWIDSITPNNPVFIARVDGHEALANAVALKQAQVTKATPTPSGGEILHDARTGEPTGIFKDQAMSLIDHIIPSPTPQQTDSAVVRGLAHADSLGVTGVSFVSAPFEALASFRRIQKAGLLSMRVTLYFPIEQWRAVADTLKADGPGDNWIRIGGVKGFMDGSAGSRTARFFQPYSDSAGYRGLWQNPPDSMARWIGNADSAGLQVAVHAIGDEANATLLAIYDSVAKAHGARDRRFRVEHAQHLRPEDIPRFGAQGVVASMQPYHAIDDGRWIQERIGPARIKTTYAFRTLLDDKATLAFGSDWTVAPLDPMSGIYAAVTRRTLDGKNPEGWVPEQKITLAETLKAYTWGPAFAVFQEKKRGTLAPGMLADVVVLDHNLFQMAPDSLDKVQVRATVVGGKLAFQR